MTSPWPNAPIEANFGFSRTRDLAFAAVRSLWRLRQSQGMKQADLAARVNRDAGWVSRKLSGPSNWTLRTFGDLVDALDGEVEIRIADLRDEPKVGNYDAYSGYGEEPVEKRKSEVTLLSPPKPYQQRALIEVQKPIGTNGRSTVLAALDAG